MLPQAKQFSPAARIRRWYCQKREYVLAADYIGCTSNIRYHPIFHNGYPIFTIVDRRLRICDAKSNRSDREKSRIQIEMQSDSEREAESEQCVCMYIYVRKRKVRRWMCVKKVTESMSKNEKKIQTDL